MNTVSNYLSALREAMKAQGLDALVIPSADPHLSEYLPEHWQARRELSGFTGSVGTFVLTTDEAGVWVDSRYW
ncbi:aminopeptidase P family N-terminal domain-containing protein, partial [Neisseria meningitidis]